MWFLLAAVQEAGLETVVSFLLQAIGGPGEVWICSAYTLICKLSLTVEQNGFLTARFPVSALSWPLTSCHMANRLSLFYVLILPRHRSV